MHRALSSLLLLSSACGGGAERQPTPQTAFTPADERQVEALSTEYGRAWVADDTAAVMELFAPDAVLVPHLGNPHAVGREAIREHFFPTGGLPCRCFATTGTPSR